jgi:hypothetical protein
VKLLKRVMAKAGGLGKAQISSSGKLFLYAF